MNKASPRKRLKSGLTPLFVLKSSLEKPIPMPDFMKLITKNEPNGGNGAKTG